MDIKFRVTGQKLMMLTKYNKFVSDAKDFMRLLFELPAEWSGYTVTAEFVQGERIVSKSLNTKKSVYFPNELSEGVCLLALRGSKAGSVVTTDSVALYIDKYIGSDGSGDNYITVELASPTISIEKDGLITAKVNQKEGYVAASSKQATLQLPVHAGGVVKPEKNNKTAVPSGVYTTGDLIISGDDNLDPSNIRKGATIFDVQGAYEGSVGIDLPEISNPARSEHVAEGKEFINELGIPSVGSLTEHTDILELSDDPSSAIRLDGDDNIIITSTMDNPHDFIARSEVKFQSKIPLDRFGDADPSQVAEGVYFTSSEGFCIPGEMKPESSGDGVQLPELNNAATDSEVFLNKEYINADGQKRSGNFSIDDELTEQDSLIYQITEALKNKASSNTSSPLPSLDNPASPDDMVTGKELYDDQGNKITGSVNLLDRLTFSKYAATEDGIISSLEADVDEDWLTLTTPPNDSFRFMLEKGAVVEAGVFLSDLGDAQPGDVVEGKTFTSTAGLKVPGTVPRKSSEDLTVNGAVITVPAGYYETQVNKGVRTASLAEPSVSVDNSGKITASVTQEEGYVSGGTKATSSQLPAQAAQIITPGTVDQTIASGKYLTGTQTVKGDSNLKAENIKKGVSIFNVEGTMDASAGGYVCKVFSLNDQTTIDTGLSSIVRFELKKVNYSEIGLMAASYPYGDIGNDTIHLIGCSSYGSYMKTVDMANLSASDYCDINGGTITWKGTSKYAMSAGINYTLVAWGTE